MNAARLNWVRYFLIFVNTVLSYVYIHGPSYNGKLQPKNSTVSNIYSFSFAVTIHPYHLHEMLASRDVDLTLCKNCEYFFFKLTSFLGGSGSTYLYLLLIYGVLWRIKNHIGFIGTFGTMVRK